MLLRPRWILGHVLVVVVAVIFVALGFWQLRRHHEKQDAVRAARAEYGAPAPAVSDAAAADERIEAAGTYDTGHDVLLRNQVRGDANGSDVLTPLLLDDGESVLVDRGWIPESALDVAPAPSGPVIVRGLAQPTSPLRPEDEVTTRDGTVSVPRVDTERIGAEVDHPLLDVWISAQFQEPPPGPGAPALPEPPPPDQVNHMQYAIQWFAFAAIPLIGWPIVLVRTRRREAAH